MDHPFGAKTHWRISHEETFGEEIMTENDVTFLSLGIILLSIGLLVICYEVTRRRFQQENWSFFLFTFGEKPKVKHQDKEKQCSQLVIPKLREMAVAAQAAKSMQAEAHQLFDAIYNTTTETERLLNKFWEAHETAVHLGFKIPENFGDYLNK
jgi:hypothetical protein